MSPQTANDIWKWVSRSISVGTLISCLGVFWKVTVFITTVNLYMAEHDRKHVDLNSWKNSIDNKMECIIEWKVATTGRPFYPDATNATR